MTESRDELGNIACHGEGDGHRNVTHQNQGSFVIFLSSQNLKMRLYKSTAV